MVRIHPELSLDCRRASWTAPTSRLALRPLCSRVIRRGRPRSAPRHRPSARLAARVSRGRRACRHPAASGPSARPAASDTVVAPVSKAAEQETSWGFGETDEIGLGRSVGDGPGRESIWRRVERLECVLESRNGLEHHLVARWHLGGCLKAPSDLDAFRRAVLKMTCGVHGKHRRSPGDPEEWAQSPKDRIPTPIRVPLGGQRARVAARIEFHEAPAKRRSGGAVSQMGAQLGRSVTRTGEPGSPASGGRCWP